MATFLALVSWIITNYKSADLLLFISALVCLLIAVVAIFLLNKKIKNKILEIERN